MSPPRQASQSQISYIEQTGPGVKKLKCEVCDKSCGTRSIIQSRHVDSNTDLSRSCKKCNTEVLCYICFIKKLCCEKKEEREKIEKLLKIKRKNSESSSVFNFSTIILAAVVVIVGALIIKFISNQKNSGGEGTLNKEDLIRREIRSLKEKFPDQEKEIWANINYIMSDSNNVIALTLLYNNDQATADCLARKLADSYAQIQNRSFSQESFFSSEDVSDYGVILEEYGSKVERTNLLIVKNLHQIKGKVARIFHTLCDSIAPRVAPSVYIFTLK